MFGELRALTLSLNFELLGLEASVTRPAPDDTPIATRGIWVDPVTEDVPVGLDLQRRIAKKVMALPRADVPTAPRGTVIVMAERHAPSLPRTWRVDELVHQAEDHTRVLVTRAE
jgi:hypothetical protein